MLRMRIADGSAAIGAICYSIVAARVADRILNARYFDNSALHALAFYFDMRAKGKAKRKAQDCDNAWFRQLRAGSLNCQCNPSRRNGTEIQSITSMHGDPPKLAPAARLSAMQFSQMLRG